MANAWFLLVVGPACVLTDGDGGWRGIGGEDGRGEDKSYEGRKEGLVGWEEDEGGGKEEGRLNEEGERKMGWERRT